MAALVNELYNAELAARKAAATLIDTHVAAAAAAGRSSFTPEEEKLQAAALQRVEGAHAMWEAESQRLANDTPTAGASSGGGSSAEDAPALSALPPLSARTRGVIARLYPGAGHISAVEQRNHFASTIRAAVTGGDPLSAAFMAVGQEEGVGSLGGYAVQTEVSRQIFSRALEQSFWIRAGVRVEPMISESKTIVAFDDSVETDDAHANLTARRTLENAEGTWQEALMRTVMLNAVKLTVYCRLSSELLEDAVAGFVDALEGAMTAAIAKKLDRLVLAGDGLGAPLGLVNAPALVTVPLETGQTAAAILWDNVVAMWARLPPGSHERSVWAVHPTALPSLLKMSVVAGVGGFSPAAGLESDGRGGYKLLGRPLYVTSRVNPLGQKGDIMLVDPTQMAVGIRSGITVARSEHALFSSDRIALRARFRGDAQPLWEKTMTLRDGTNTVSPYVTLTARP